MTRTVGEWLGWLGVVVGCLSAISAIARVLSIGLGGIFAEMVSFYREAFGPLFRFLMLLRIDLTPSQADLLLLYLVLFMMSVRAGLLPLLQSEIRNAEQDRRAIPYEEVADISDISTSEDFPPNTVSAQKIESGKYLLHRYRYRPDWQMYLIRFVYTILLLPVITFLPLRRAIRFRGSSIFHAMNVVKLSFSVSDNGNEKGFIEYGGTHYNITYLRTLRSYAVVAGQAAALPLAVLLFFVLAKYSPI